MDPRVCSHGFGEAGGHAAIQGPQERDPDQPLPGGVPSQADRALACPDQRRGQAGGPSGGIACPSNREGWLHSTMILHGVDSKVHGTCVLAGTADGGNILGFQKWGAFEVGYRKITTGCHVAGIFCASPSILHNGPPPVSKFLAVSMGQGQWLVS